MVQTCAVFNCKKRFSTGDGTKFFRFPSVRKNGNEELRNLQLTRKLAWLKAINRSNLSDKQLQSDIFRVCSRHFITGCPAKLNDETNPDWIPSLHLGPDPESFIASKTVRYQRQQKRIGQANVSTPRDINQHALVPTNLPQFCIIMNDQDDGHVSNILGMEVHDPERNFENGDVSNVATLEHKVSILSTENKNLHKELAIYKVKIEQYKTKLNREKHKNQEVLQQNKKLELEVTHLNSKLYVQNECINNMSLTKEGFLNNDQKTLYYTGLNSFPLLDVVYSAIESHLGEIGSLTKFQQFLIFLMRMRLDLGFTDLAYRFNVSANTISTVFYNVLDICYGTFHHIVYWPTRDELHATMPMKYRDAFGNKVAIIIDCFEVFAETPTSLSADSMVDSHYKKHVTAKFLIGITPQGTVAFVSNGYGGRKSDKYITEDSGILNNLRVGDFVLSDRGFDIADVADVFCCTIKMPPFKKGEKQLEPFELDAGRNISQLRIDVERVIGALRNKFKILGRTLQTGDLQDDNSGYSSIDKITYVACALFNHCPGIVETY